MEKHEIDFADKVNIKDVTTINKVIIASDYLMEVFRQI